MKTKLFYLMLTAFLGLSFASCKKSENNPELVLDHNLLKSASKYSTLADERKGGPGEFTIEHLVRNGNVLTISVKGGCKEEDFQIVWNGVIMFSSPGPVNLLLYNKSEQDCGTDNLFDIKVNLESIVGKQDAKSFIYNVANGSKRQDFSLNINGTVSAK